MRTLLLLALMAGTSLSAEYSQYIGPNGQPANHARLGPASNIPIGIVNIWIVDDQGIAKANFIHPEYSAALFQ